MGPMNSSAVDFFFQGRKVMHVEMSGCMYMYYGILFQQTATIYKQWSLGREAK